VAFGRTAQYQSLNMFLSFTALYFYSQLITSKQNLVAKTLAGTVALSLSILSHWDAVFILPPIIIFFAKFLLDKTFQREYKIRLLGLNFLLGCTLLLPFLMPFIQTLRMDRANQEYLWDRVGLRPDIDQNGNVFTFSLYNPFLAIWLYAIMGVAGLLAYKKSYIFAVWAAFVLAIFIFLVHHSGTHIYNLTIPVIILVAAGFEKTLKVVPNYLGIIVALGMGGFLYYQSYLLFVDHKVEYPWEREHILSWKTPGHSALDNMRNKIGFPHKRYWKEINEYVNRQNQENGEDFGFITNEDKSLSSYYMDVERTQNLDGFYYIGIKRPYSFQTDWKMPQVSFFLSYLVSLFSEFLQIILFLLQRHMNRF
ncbi:MAG: Glycosyl transferase family 39, partial [candidate division WWE3 bacterium GW2011_GWC1_47_10]